MEYKTEDRILLMLHERNRLPDPCPIRIKVTDRDVCLYVGPRVWQWDRETGHMVGCGTCMVGPIPESPADRRVGCEGELI